MEELPAPSISNNLPRGWICKVRSSQNWELMIKTQGNPCGHSLPIHNHWSLIRVPHYKHDGVWIKEGHWGQLPAIPSSGLLSFWSVLVWSQGGNVGGLLLAVAAVASGGLGIIPSVPPRLVLKLWLEWDITLPYSPSPGI